MLLRFWSPDAPGFTSKNDELEGIRRRTRRRVVLWRTSKHQERREMGKWGTGKFLKRRRRP